MNLQARVDMFTPLLQAANTPMVVGSSYGGITALCSAIQHADAGGTLTGLVLCAPALARAEPPATDLQLVAPVRTVIIHGVDDDVVPIAVSRDLAARDSNVQLIEVADGHRLANSLELIVAATRAVMSGEAITAAG